MSEGSPLSGAIVDRTITLYPVGHKLASSFSAWGVTGIIFGILLACCWPAVGLVGTRWYSLGVLVFGW